MEIQLNSREITENKQLNKNKRKSSKKLYIHKNQLQHNLLTPAQQNTIGGGQSDLQLTKEREGPTKERSNNNQNPITSREPKKMA